MNINHTHLTDSLERELLQQAIAAQYEYPRLDELMVKLFRKIVSFFRGPEVVLNQTHTAH
ncbi:hypothetical protein [Castellaniella sp. GW247-6E4]|uniref:hypothetical protein n=1 Tax=Castellaniella sp. GW247-6E4 TaxID=3140380 RepID=UPI003314F64B